MKFCPFCGAAFIGGAVSFCSECGKSVAPSMRTRPDKQARQAPKTQSKKRPVRRSPPPVRPKPEKRCSPEAERKPRRNPMDENYDGYYDDVPTGDNGQATERFEPELVKRIALVAGGAIIVVILCVVVMSLL